MQGNERRQSRGRIESEASIIGREASFGSTIIVIKNYIMRDSVACGNLTEKPVWARGRGGGLKSRGPLLANHCSVCASEQFSRLPSARGVRRTAQSLVKPNGSRGRSVGDWCGAGRWECFWCGVGWLRRGYLPNHRGIFRCRHTVG